MSVHLEAIMTHRSLSILFVFATALVFGLLACTPTHSSNRADRAGATTPYHHSIHAEPQAFADPGADRERDQAPPFAEQTATSPNPPAELAREQEGDELGSLGGARSKASRSAEPLAMRPSPREQGGSVARPLPSRPGLGTSFGQNRTSYVQSTSFERAHRSPDDLLSIFYNDAAGVEAASGRVRFDFPSNRSDALDGMISVEVLDMSGHPFPGTRAGGRDFVVGRDGEYYSIRLRNHGSERLEVVASVDGLDVLDGTIASTEKRGYLLPSFGSLEIDGFRRSTTTVAGFRFGSVAQSYAERKGLGRNVGVIGIAVFRERIPEPIWDDHELRRRDRAQPFPRGFATPPPGHDYE